MSCVRHGGNGVNGSLSRIRAENHEIRATARPELPDPSSLETASVSAVLRFLMGPSVAYSTEGLPFRVDQFSGSRPVAAFSIRYGNPPLRFLN